MILYLLHLSSLGIDFLAAIPVPQVSIRQTCLHRGSLLRPDNHNLYIHVSSFIIVIVK